VTSIRPNLDTAIGAISSVTLGIYLLIAISLSILAILSFYDVALQMLTIIQAYNTTEGILQVLHALLLTIIIVEILETVTVYFKTSKILVTPILIAGITAMVRRVLTFGVETVDALDIALTLAAILVLTVAIVYIGRMEKADGF
jgi:uncharacterized membrane protein (DUF373 family)